MGISSLYNIATSALNAQQMALDVIGQNIANVNTPGYSEEQAVLTSGPSVNRNGYSVGSGVEVQTIQRSYSAMLQGQLASGNSSYQANLAVQTALTQIEPSFNDVASSNGLSTNMDNFFNAWQNLSADPTSSADKQLVLSSAQTLTDSFNQISTTLSGVASSENQSLTGITASATANAKSLAQINTQILTAQGEGGNANQLLDQRDQLLQSLSQQVGITSTIQSNGTATVTLAGGQTLVSGSSYATLYLNPTATAATATSPATNDIMLTAAGNPPAAAVPATDTDVTATIGGTGNTLGEIGGALQVTTSIVPGYLSQLNELASTLVTSVNSQEAQGYGSSGTTGNNFFTASGVTAATIALDPSLTTSTLATGLPTASDPAPTSAGNNGNALAIAGIQSQSLAFSSGSNTLDGFYDSLVNKVATDTQNATNQTSAGSANLQQLTTLNSSNSGVAMNDELTKLTTYQQAFQGASQLINTATSCTDALLAMIGAPS